MTNKNQRIKNKKITKNEFTKLIKNKSKNTASLNCEGKRKDLNICMKISF